MVNTQQTRPALVNTALPKLRKIKPFHGSIFSPPFTAAMYNVNGLNISPSEIVNIEPREGRIPVSFTSEPN